MARSKPNSIPARPLLLTPLAARGTNVKILVTVMIVLPDGSTTVGEPYWGYSQQFSGVIGPGTWVPVTLLPGEPRTVETLEGGLFGWPRPVRQFAAEQLKPDTDQVPANRRIAPGEAEPPPVTTPSRAAVPTSPPPGWFRASGAFRRIAPASYPSPPRTQALSPISSPRH